MTFQRFTADMLDPEKSISEDTPAKVAKVAKMAEIQGFQPETELRKSAKVAKGDPAFADFRNTFASPDQPEPRRNLQLSQLSQLSQAPAPKNDFAWTEIYHERMAIMLEDGGTTEAQARAEAHREAFLVWLRHNPLPEPKEGCCARCNFPITGPDAGGFWYRDSEHMDPVPTHGKCLQLLQHERKRDAERALRGCGIYP